MARLGSRQRKANRLKVTELADENNVGILAQGRAQKLQ
jgi:hypothetical protein